MNPLDAQFQLGVFAESNENFYHTLRADFCWFQGVPQSRLNRLGPSSSVFHSLCDPGLPEPAWALAGSPALLPTVFQVATSQGVKWKQSDNFMLLTSLCSYRHGLLASPGLREASGAFWFTQGQEKEKVRVLCPGNIYCVFVRWAGTGPRQEKMDVERKGIELKTVSYKGLFVIRYYVLKD